MRKGLGIMSVPVQQGVDQAPKIWTPLFICITAGIFIIGVISPCVLSGTPLYFQRVGESTFFAGMMLTVYEAALVTSRIVSGFLVERFSRKLILLCGAVSLVIGALLTIIAPTTATHILTRVFLGAGFSASHTAAASAASDVLPKERLGEGIGYSTLGGAFGLAIGPMMALFLTSFDYAESLMVGILILGILMLVVGLLLQYEKRPQILHPTAGYRLAWEVRQQGLSVSSSLGLPAPAPVKRQVFEKAALRGGVPMFFFSVGVMVFFAYTAIYGREAGYSNPSLFFVVAALSAVSIRLFVSKLFNSNRALVLFALASLVAAIALVGIYMIESALVFYLLGIGYGVGFGIAVPLLNSVSIKASPPQHFGTANSTYFLLMDLGFAIGAFVWGVTVSAGGYLPVFFGGAAFMMLALMASMILIPRARNKD